MVQEDGRITITYAAVRLEAAPPTIHGHLALGGLPRIRAEIIERRTIDAIDRSLPAWAQAGC